MSRRLLDGKRPKPKKGANPGGRPTKLDIDPKLMDRLRQAILMGAPVLTAAALNDISYDTMRNWVLMGKENPDSQYGALLRVLNKAIAEWEVRDLSVIEAHALGRPAQYAMQPVRNNSGEIVYGPEKDKDGQPKPLIPTEPVA